MSTDEPRVLGKLLKLADENAITVSGCVPFEGKARTVQPMAAEVSMKPIQRLAFIGNSLPRRCGIATFTTDLHRAINGLTPAPQR